MRGRWKVLGGFAAIARQCRRICGMGQFKRFFLFFLKGDWKVCRREVLIKKKRNIWRRLRFRMWKNRGEMCKVAGIYYSCLECEKMRGREGQDGGGRRGGILEWEKGTDGGIDAFRLCLKKGLECEKKRGKVREKRRGKSLLSFNKRLTYKKFGTNKNSNSV